MSTFEEEAVPEPEELLDSSRLAAAWELARERAAEPAGSSGAEGEAGAAEAEPAEAPVAWEPPASASASTSASAASAASSSATPVIPPALPVAVAYRLFLDELRRLRSTSPELAAQAKKVLVVPLKKLSAALDPLDGAAAEKLLDGLEDLLQSLLATAEWPTAGEE